MPKLYYPTPDELQGATPLNELLWFPWMQSQLLRLANTNEGRDLLCIDSWQQQPYPIIKMGKNFVRFDMGYENGRHVFKTDVRVGAKWANVMRYRWQDFVKALDRNTLLDIRSWPTVYDGERLLLPIGGGTTTTVYPDPDSEGSPTTVDGRVGRNVSNNTWDALRNGAGNDTAYAVATVDTWIYLSSGSSAWDIIRRSIILFDACDIDDGDTLDSAVFSTYSGGETNNFTGVTPAANIFSSNPASDTALQHDDYADCGTTAFSTAKNAAAWNDSGYSDFTLNSSGEAAVKFDDITRLSLYESVYDAPDSEPTRSGNDSKTITFNASFSERSGTGSDPKLVIVHSIPFTPTVILF
jgi:hypothetical protein